METSEGELRGTMEIQVKHNPGMETVFNLSITSFGFTKSNRVISKKSSIDATPVGKAGPIEIRGSG